MLAKEAEEVELVKVEEMDHLYREKTMEQQRKKDSRRSRSMRRSTSA
jgi:hypothetical protein